MVTPTSISIASERINGDVSSFAFSYGPPQTPFNNTMQIQEPTRYFLLGVGFVGGTILNRIRENDPQAQVSVLVRADEQERVLGKIGVRAVKGDLNDAEIIRKEVGQADVSGWNDS
jgi:nucleoside-diphosphate-sugar epimerase